MAEERKLKHYCIYKLLKKKERKKKRFYKGRVTLNNQINDGMVKAKVPKRFSSLWESTRDVILVSCWVRKTAGNKSVEKGVEEGPNTKTALLKKAFIAPPSNVNVLWWLGQRLQISQSSLFKKGILYWDLILLPACIVRVCHHVPQTRVRHNLVFKFWPLISSLHYFPSLN